MWFSHLQDIQIQKGALGSQFRAGTVIGTMGSTGNSTGPHIDITMPNGKGGYYSATDVAKEIGIQQRLSTSNKKNNWSDTQINNLAIDTGKTIGELNAMTNDQLTQEARKTAPGIVDNLAKKIEPTIMLLGIDTDTAKQILQLIYANEDEQAIIKLMKDNNIVGRTSSDGVQYTPEKIYTILKGASMKQ